MGKVPLVVLAGSSKSSPLATKVMLWWGRLAFGEEFLWGFDKLSAEFRDETGRKKPLIQRTLDNILTCEQVAYPLLVVGSSGVAHAVSKYPKEKVKFVPQSVSLGHTIQKGYSAAQQVHNLNGEHVLFITGDLPELTSKVMDSAIVDIYPEAVKPLVLTFVKRSSIGDEPKDYGWYYDHKTKGTFEAKESNLLLVNRSANPVELNNFYKIRRIIIPPHEEWNWSKTALANFWNFLVLELAGIAALSPKDTGLPVPIPQLVGGLRVGLYFGKALTSKLLHKGISMALWQEVSDAFLHQPTQYLENPFPEFSIDVDTRAEMKRVGLYD